MIGHDFSPTCLRNGLSPILRIRTEHTLIDDFFRKTLNLRQRLFTLPDEVVDICYSFIAKIIEVIAVDGGHIDIYLIIGYTD